MESHPILKDENSFSLIFCFLKELSKSNENLSTGFLPTISSNKIDISLGFLAKHPGVVSIGISKFCPWRSAAIKPGVGLKPYIFAYAAGPRHEPI